ncbi:hypothetical protein ACFY84_33315 [Streptomyces sp. NPDC012438]|uniref:hypothetical protein n=1 Tax=Streptomyces sp. NPDC012438 TaxID=3364833 RepID=UPI0036F14A05
MSVSLYYRVRRTEPLTGAESAATERITAAHHASFPYGDEEALYFWSVGDDSREVLAGSTRMPSDPGRCLPVIAHVLDSLTELRRALPGTDWHVHLDDLDVPWDEAEGYALPGMRDPEFRTDPEGP